VNRQKRSLGLNIKHPSGQKIVRQLVEQADVLVENYVPGKLAEMGLGYEQLKELNPKLIYASLTGIFLSSVSVPTPRDLWRHEAD
jgi:succinate---hydroxymethylglutarate CoA-transferase